MGSYVESTLTASLQEMQDGFSFGLPEVTEVTHWLLLCGGTRACAGFGQQGVCQGGTGMRVEGGNGRECLKRGMGVTAASCSITVGIGHGQRQERRGSNV